MRRQLLLLGFGGRVGDLWPLAFKTFVRPCHVIINIVASLTELIDLLLLGGNRGRGIVHAHLPRIHQLEPRFVTGVFQVFARRSMATFTTNILKRCRLFGINEATFVPETNSMTDDAFRVVFPV